MISDTGSLAQAEDAFLCRAISEASQGCVRVIGEPEIDRISQRQCGTGPIPAHGRSSQLAIGSGKQEAGTLVPLGQ